MPIIKIKHNYGLQPSDGTQRHSVWCFAGGRWQMLTHVGFTADAVGELIAVSHIKYQSEDGYRFTEVHNLVLGVRVVGGVELVWADGLVLIPGEQYHPPTISDAPKAQVVRIK